MGGAVSGVGVSLAISLLGNRNRVELRGPDVRVCVPHAKDQGAWIALRARSRAFLEPWEPTWSDDAVRPEGYRLRLRRFLSDWKKGNSFCFFIFRNNDDQLVGGITLHNVRYGVCQSASVGYWIGAPFQRRGYMTQALALALRFGFRVVSLNRIEAACMPDNAPSRKLLEKSGFRQEGLARSYLMINGTWEDHVIYSLLRCDRTVGLSVVHRSHGAPKGRVI